MNSYQEKQVSLIFFTMKVSTVVSKITLMILSQRQMHKRKIAEICSMSLATAHSLFIISWIMEKCVQGSSKTVDLNSQTLKFAFLQHLNNSF